MTLQPAQGGQRFAPGRATTPLLVAEIVAGAVCAKKIERREANFEYEDESPDWHFYYAEYSRLMTEFLPRAHRLQVDDVS